MRPVGVGLRRLLLVVLQYFIGRIIFVFRV